MQTDTTIIAPPSSQRSMPLTVTAGAMLTVGTVLAIVPVPLAPRVLTLALGVLLVLVGAVLLVVAPRRRSRFAAASAVLTVLLMLAVVRTGHVLVRTVDDATGPNAHITARLDSAQANFYNGYPDGERPADAGAPDDPVVSKLRRINAHDGQRLVSVTGGVIEVAIWKPRPVGAVLAVVRDLLPPALLAFGIATTLLLLRRVRVGDPFGRGTTRLLQVLGAVLLIGLPLAAALEGIAAQAALGGRYGFLGQPGDVVSAVPDIATVVPGILLLIVASAWRVGTELRELGEGTV